jgi:hypothetical protein
MTLRSRFVAILSALVLCLTRGPANAFPQSCAGNSRLPDPPRAADPGFPAPLALAPPRSAPPSFDLALPNGSGGSGGQTIPDATSHQQPLSRLGIGANISPLGVGINGTTPLSDYFDARLMGNFLSYTSPQFDIEGFRGAAQLHLASMAASLDWYPHNSIWRLSPGLMFYNGNQLSFTSLVEAGTSFSLDGQNFYSASANAATGATPLKGTGVLGLHGHPVAFTAAGGFGRFVPHSNRHWSFPSEFGVVFMGAPTANVTLSGWVCLDPALTQCSNIGNLANPIAQQFHSALQAQLVKWRTDLSKVDIYPMFSYSVVYSFNIP